MACDYRTFSADPPKPSTGAAGTSGARFSCGDLLQDDVSAAGLVVLADQCWDAPLAAAAAAKLARELPAGAFCVSYSGAGFRSQPHKVALEAVAQGPSAGVEGGKAVTARWEVAAAFHEVAALRAPVSWTEGQAFHVFQKR